MSYANNKGADQPEHPRSPISDFVIRCLDSIIPLLAIAEISRLQLASAAKPGRFESLLVANPKGRFSRDLAQFVKQLANYPFVHKELSHAMRKCVFGSL